MFKNIEVRLSKMLFFVALFCCFLGCRNANPKTHPNRSYKNTIEQFAFALSEPNKVDSAQFFQKLDASFKTDGHFFSLTDSCIYTLFLAKYDFEKFGEETTNANVLYNKAITSEENQNLEKNVQLWMIADYAWYAYQIRDMQTAMKLYSQSVKMLASVPQDSIIDAINTYKHIGYFLGTIREMKLAIEYLRKSLEVKTVNQWPSLKGEILNNIANYCINLGHFSEAAANLDSAMVYAKLGHDSLRIAKILGSRGQMFLSQNKYDEAIPIIESDIQISKQMGESVNRMFAENLLSNAYTLKKDAAKAVYCLDQALEIAKTKSYLKADEFDFLGRKLNLVRQYKLSCDTNAILLRMNALRDVIDKTDGRNALEIASLKFANTINADKQNDITASLEKEQYQNKIYVLLVLGLTILIVVVFKLFQNRLKKKEVSFELTLQKLDLEKIESEVKLAQATQDVASYMVFLNERNKQIEALKQELNTQKENPVVDNQYTKGHMDAILSQHLITEENWLSFKNAFIKENPSFFEKLQAQYPGLTDSNMRIIFLTKLGLSNQEVANLLGVTYDAVKKAKQRLRVKLGMNLSDFLEN